MVENQVVDDRDLFVAKVSAVETVVLLKQHDLFNLRGPVNPIV
jgi:hypothetical protein